MEIENSGYYKVIFHLTVSLLQANFILETDTRRAWLPALASNKVLETLVFFSTSLQKVNHKDLENLVHNCPNLTSLKTSFADINEVRTIFSSAQKLGISEFFPCKRRTTFICFSATTGTVMHLAIGNVNWEAMKLLLNGASASRLMELDIRIGFVSKSGFCDLIRLCYNLKLLFANNVIGDGGLVEVGNCCHHLRKTSGLGTSKWVSWCDHRTGSIGHSEKI